MIGPSLQPKPGTAVDQRLIAANNLIQLSAIELEQAVIHELDENPALELIERSRCPLCGAPVQLGACTCCPGSFGASVPQSSLYERSSAAGAAPDEPGDAFWSVAAPLTLAERLLMQLRLTLDAADQKIAWYVTGSLDEHGYFASSIDDIAQLLQVEPARVQYVLEQVQQLDPPGIGARNIIECLLIQLRQLVTGGKAVPAAAQSIIEHYLEELGRQQFEQIRRALHISREEVEAAFLFIRANLHPYPAHHHFAQAHDSTPASPPVVPSVLIRHSMLTPGGYEVEVVESQRFVLRVHPLYQQLRQTHLVTSPAEREHIAHFAERARLFIGYLRRRSLLLYKVATYLVDHQRDFLDHGPLELRALTRGEVAQALGVHVSTISRATREKFALHPSQRMIPLSQFFASEQHPLEQIRQIITSETVPLSDENIAKLLSEKHHIILSRQMVAHYRAELGIPSARQRDLLQHNQKKRT